MFHYEKLGAFYLGKEFDLARQESRSDFVMYDAKDLTTHAVIVGMTGSGKTGLGITLLEEAAIDGIPALVIDPKGDMGNLLLNFPQLRPEDFRPWVEPTEAARKGMTVDEFAADRSQLWKDGLASWDQGPDRISKLAEAAEVSIYTPGSDAGLQLTVLRSFSAPPAAVLNNSDAMRERVSSAVSGLLALLGIDADPLRSREHILLSNIVDHAWRAGRNLDLPQLIREIQTPPFTSVGIMDLETIFPEADRLKMAMTVNNVLASPTFAGWMRGEPLNIQRLLYTPEGKPRVTILSIAHLTDQERMFFVTIFLNEVLSWMRSQPGTSSLRALLYMDEVFGYLPPTANPPSKTPLLTLLKQARAFGLGLVLATQNPVDLDYKALSNAGTWFLGRLQTERDKLRVLDGLEGASASAGAGFDRKKIEQTLSAVGSRTFLLNNVHEDEPVVFQTRWVLSYLRGPLTREQIAKLMQDKKPAHDEEVAQAVPTPATAPHIIERQKQSAPAKAPAVASVLLPPEIPQRFARIFRATSRDADIVYRPALLGIGSLHFSDSKSDVDYWTDVARIVAVAADDHVSKDPWTESDPVAVESLELNSKPVPDAQFEELPRDCGRKSSYRSWTASFKKSLYRTERLTLSHCPELKMYSHPEDREGDFLARLKHHAREKRDLEIEKLRAKYGKSIETIRDRIRRAEERVAEEKQQAQSATLSAAMSFGTSILGALLGRKKLSTTNVSRAATSVRAAGRAADQRGDISRAEAQVESLTEDVKGLEDELEKQTNAIERALSLEGLEIAGYEITPRKSDISAEDVALLWLPYLISPTGIAEPAFD